MRIKSIKLRNFKGIKSFETTFNGGPTSIYGENGVGKTTLVDAYMWLLFDKDSSNRTAFNIKTLDKENNPIHRLEHEVEADFSLDGSGVTLRKTLREKWVKKRGTETEEFAGHETEYYINDVPKKKAEYSAFIASEMGNEATFRLVSIPSHFASLPWQNQRELLFAMAGEISDQVIAAGNTKYENLLSTIAQSKTSLDDYNKAISNKIRKLKAELEDIPGRLDEVDRNKPAVKDWADLEKQIAALKAEQDAMNGSASAVAESHKAELAKVEALRIELREETAIHEKAVSDARVVATEKRTLLTTEREAIQDKITDASSKVSALRKKLSEVVSDKTLNEAAVIELRDDWHTENNKKPDISVATCCPTCNRDFDADKIEQERGDATKRFNEAKAARLKVINEKGAALKVLIEEASKETEIIKASIAKLDEEMTILIPQRDKIVIPSIDSLIVQPAENVNIARLGGEINAILTAIKPAEVDPSVQNKRTELASKITELEKSLGDRELITKAEARITELNAQQKLLSQTIADQEREQDTIAAFNKERIMQIENRISGMFEMVKFRLFTTQINGGEAETCEAMVEGVPWSDLNTAGKINAGIDIINALSGHFGIVAPLWIDGRESVTKLIPTKAQTISLVVQEGQKSLLIN